LDTDNLEMFEYSLIKELNDKLIHRMSTTSALFQMFNCLCDVIIFDDNKIIYIQEVTLRYAKDNYVFRYEKVLLFSLKYGDKTNYQPGLKETAHLSRFIHPVFEVHYNYRHIFDFHLAEHLLGEFKLQKVHIEPLEEFLDIINGYNGESNIEELKKLHEHDDIDGENVYLENTLKIELNKAITQCDQDTINFLNMIMLDEKSP
jgi:hypothetical protein